MLRVLVCRVVGRFNQEKTSYLNWLEAYDKPDILLPADLRLAQRDHHPQHGQHVLYELRGAVPGPLRAPGKLFHDHLQQDIVVTVYHKPYAVAVALPPTPSPLHHLNPSPFSLSLFW
jgi:hypothetical protein